MPEQEQQPRILFPIFFLQFVDPENFLVNRKKLGQDEAREAFGELFESVLIYAFDHFYLKEFDHTDFCDEFDIDYGLFEKIYSESKSERIMMKVAEYEHLHGKKSATVKIQFNYLLKLYNGEMSFFTFALIVAVLSRFGNLKKTKGKHLWQIITYDEIKARMLGFTQRDKIAREVMKVTRITEVRMKKLLQDFDGKLFYRYHDGRKYFYTSRTNYKSVEEFYKDIARVNAERIDRRKNSAARSRKMVKLLTQRYLNEMNLLVHAETPGELMIEEVIRECENPYIDAPHPGHKS